MSRAVLGIGYGSREAAAALAVDGKIVAAGQEEWFSRVRHDAQFPYHTILYCLEEANLELQELAAVAVVESLFPAGLRWLSRRRAARALRRLLHYRGKIVSVPRRAGATFAEAWAVLDAAGKVSASLLGQSRIIQEPGVYLGPAFSDEEVAAFLDTHSHPGRRLSGHERAETVAEALAGGCVVGYFSGRMEFGSQTRGARSILADPRRHDLLARLMRGVEQGGSCRLFAPSTEMPAPEELASCI